MFKILKLVALKLRYYYFSLSISLCAQICKHGNYHFSSILLRIYLYISMFLYHSNTKSNVIKRITLPYHYLVVPNKLFKHILQNWSCNKAAILNYGGHFVSFFILHVSLLINKIILHGCQISCFQVL